MKSIGYIGIFLISAVSMFTSLQRQQQVDQGSSNHGIASPTSNMNWDQANRRKAEEVFFTEAPTWMRDSKSTDTYTPRAAVGSNVQTNPFSQ